MPSCELCVIIPAFQAERTIGPLVQGVVSLGFPVIVVDDASTDSTSVIAKSHGAQVVRCAQNHGKGNALRRGFQEAMKRGHYRFFLTMDADGQHRPQDISEFLRKLNEGTWDLIVGNRMQDPRGMPWERRLTNRFMSWLLSRMAGVEIPDTQCGFRLLSRQLLERVPLTSDRFEIESEITVKSAWSGFRIASIPVSSVYQREISFIRPLRDTVRFVRFVTSLRRP